jgi:hypothetical protein
MTTKWEDICGFFVKFGEGSLYSNAAFRGERWR